MKSIRYVSFLLLALLITACSSSKGLRKNNLSQTLSNEDKRLFNYFFTEALNQEAQGNNDASFDLLQKAVSIDSMSGAASYMLGNDYLVLNQVEKALDLFGRAARIDTTNFWYAMQEVNILMAIDRAQQAADLLEGINRRWPNEPEVTFSIAEVYRRMGKLDKAIEAFDRLQDQVGLNEALVMQKFNLYKMNGQIDSAFIELQTLPDAHPSVSRYKILVGDQYLDLGMLPQADSVYSKFEPELGNDPYWLISRSNYYNRVGNVEAADSLVKAALVNEDLEVKIKESLLDGYLKTLFRRGESLDGVDDLFTTVINQHPQAGELNNLYFRFLISADRDKEAAEQLGYAKDKDPMNKDLWINLASIYAELKDYNNMELTLNEALEVFENDPQIYEYIGYSYGMQKKMKESIASYKKAMEFTPEQQVTKKSELSGFIGDNYFMLDSLDLAFEAYDKALEYNPQNVLVLNNYGYYLSLMEKDLYKAERMSGLAVKLEPKNATYLDTYAWIYFKQGNYMLALFYIRQAMQNVKEPSFEILDHYGDILFMDGQAENAIEQWKKALEIADKEFAKPDEERIELVKRKISNKNYIEE